MLGKSFFLGRLFLFFVLGEFLLMPSADGEKWTLPTMVPLTPIASAWVFYLVVFHSLSNLPIDKMRLFLGILTHKRAL